MTDTTDPREGGSEYAELLRHLDVRASGAPFVSAVPHTVLMERAAAAIRALEAKVKGFKWLVDQHKHDVGECRIERDRLTEQLDNMARLEAAMDEHHDRLEKEHDRLAGEVERLEMKLREKQREMDMREEDNREDILSLREFGERVSNEVARLAAELLVAQTRASEVTSELAAARENGGSFR